MVPGRAASTQPASCTRICTRLPRGGDGRAGAATSPLALAPAAAKTNGHLHLASRGSTWPVPAPTWPPSSPWHLTAGGVTRSDPACPGASDPTGRERGLSASDTKPRACPPSRPPALAPVGAPHAPQATMTPTTAGAGLRPGAHSPARLGPRVLCGGRQCCLGLLGGSFHLTLLLALFCYFILLHFILLNLISFHSVFTSFYSLCFILLPLISFRRILFHLTSLFHFILFHFTHFISCLFVSSLSFYFISLNFILFLHFILFHLISFYFFILFYFSSFHCSPFSFVSFYFLSFHFVSSHFV